MVELGVAIVATINAMIRFSVPITFGALSGIFSERSGVVNIGIDGMMLMSAFTGYMTNVALSQPGVSESLQAGPTRLGIALAVALLTGGAMGLLHALLSIQYKVDQIISGTVINILALGLTGYFYQEETRTLGKLPNLINNPWNQSGAVELKLADNFKFYFPYDIGRILFDKDLLTYLSIIMVFVVGWALFHTTWGLRTRAVGENPRAADTLGINVHRTQYMNLFISGMMAGLAGAFLTLAAVGSFERGMTTGRGFIALAVMIFGNWKPSGALKGALLFGFAMALQNQLQLFGINFPHQLVAMLPYILTIVVLAGFVGRVQGPAASGEVYEQE
ncbi:MAG TPA: ABC transporter permease [Aggregatilinea sp.]|jgi:simple sugar transport system permease protein|uniref:ABC transporter permease n=1 Tax=Aggregatilinea sp. TaxID=2806333 RepID=UPI002BFAB7CF|nr:ABC transporter permease [Aggregatilinea sp.]HML24431.1 ABC transporter permease [Aggregatilinea sp.]